MTSNLEKMLEVMDAPNWAVKRAEKWLLLWLVRLYDEDEHCTMVSRGELMELCGLSKRAINYTMKRLEYKGLLTRITQSGYCNRYQINLEVLNEARKF
jgi:DNA-binding transcriptional ArsR family regulator